MRTLSSVLVSACASLAVLLSGCSDPTRPDAPLDASRPALALASGTGTLVSFASDKAPGKCIDVYDGDAAAGTKLIIWTCHGGSNQQFTWNAKGEIRTKDGTMCVDASGGGGRNGDPIVTWPCHGGPNQRWTATEAGEIKGIDGKCIDIYDGRTANGSRLVLYTCHGGPNQRWETGRGPASDLDPAPPPSSSTRPVLPQRFVNTSYVAPTGRTISVRAGDDLQSAINAAQPGDEIVLAAGATFTGNFYLPKKSGSGWVTIRGADLPPAGVRVTPAVASRMPKVVTPNYTHAIRTLEGAHNYRLVGLEIKASSAASWNYALVAIGSGYYETLAKVPTNIIIDRSYIHGHSSLKLKRCVELNAAYGAIIDSYLSECHSNNQDSQAIIAWNGPGPLKITNNFLEGGAENILLGGADPRIPNLVPSDIEIRGNYVYKPLWWKDRWMVKNLLELKSARRVLVEGNVFENSWADGQTGFAFVFGSVNQNGGCSWCGVTDVTMRYNAVRNVAGGFQLAGNAGTKPAVVTQRIAIEHNLLTGVGASGLGTNGRLYQMAGPIRDLRVVHNTGLSSYHSLYFVSQPAQLMPGLVIRDNITGGGTYQVFSSYGAWSAALKLYGGSAYDFRGNVVVTSSSSSTRPSGNYYPTSTSAVGFASYSGGDLRLTSASPYVGKATDGTTPGANMTTLMDKIAGATKK